LPARMNAGIFLACSDDLEFFESGKNSLDFTHAGVTALAHPGSVDIGCSHGVFVVPSPKENALAQPQPCLRFLHKPSPQLMQETGAILPNGQVYLDSCFYFDMPFAKLLLKIYHEHNLDCEIDAYGDFLQPLGSKSSISYVDNPKNVSVFTPSLVEMRRILYNVLRNASFQMIPLVPSLFIHLGTCIEYIEHFGGNLQRFGFQKSVLVAIQGKHNISPNSCVMHTHMDGDFVVEEQSVIEFCEFVGVALVVGKRCILADLCYGSYCGQLSNAVIPDGVFMQTLSIDRSKLLTAYPAYHSLYLPSSSEPLFVTIVFGTGDDFKNSSGQATLLDVPVTSIAHALGVGDIWDNQPGIWNARLFPVANSPTEAVEFAFAFLSVVSAIKIEDVSLHNLVSEWKRYIRLSMGQCLQFKDLMNQFNRRNALTEKLGYLTAK